MLSQFQHWLLVQGALLSQLFGPDNVMLDDEDWQAIVIINYPLPNNWASATSRLMIVFPSGSQALISPPDHFYLDQGLRTTTDRLPAHYFEGRGFNDRMGDGWARYSFHVTSRWRANASDHSGSSLIKVLDALDHALYIAAKEA